MNVPDTTPNAPAATTPAAAASDPSTATPPASAVSGDAAPAKPSTEQAAPTSAIGPIVADPALATPAAADPAAAKKAGTPPAKGDEATPVAPEEYAKAVTLGDAEDLKGAQLNPDVLNAVIPAAQELGIKPEQLSRLAQEMTRALAKQQTQISEAESKKFNDDFTARRQQAIDTLKPEGIAEVRTALGKYLKPGSFFAHMVDMGLGNDLDFLALCQDYGKLIKPDTAPGTGDGAGAGKGNYNWKEDWAAPGGAK